MNLNRPSCAGSLAGPVLSTPFRFFVIGNALEGLRLKSQLHVTTACGGGGAVGLRRGGWVRADAREQAERPTGLIMTL